MFFFFTVQTKSPIVSYSSMQTVQESVQRQKKNLSVFASCYIAKQNVEQSSRHEPFTRCTEVCLSLQYSEQFCLCAQEVFHTFIPHMI